MGAKGTVTPTTRELEPWERDILLRGLRQVYGDEHGRVLIGKVTDLVRDDKIVVRIDG